MRAVTVCRTVQAATPAADTAVPETIEDRGRAKAGTVQSAGPTTGTTRAGRPSSGVRVKAEALATA